MRWLLARGLSLLLNCHGLLSVLMTWQPDFSRACDEGEENKLEATMPLGDLLYSRA